MRFRLRTLTIVLALGPPLIAAMWFGRQYIWEFFTEFSIPGIVGPRE